MVGVKSRIKVLLVDDSSIYRKAVYDFLKKRANLDIVGQASNGHEALKLSKQLSPDVIIMDVNMPVLDGIQATRQLSQHSPQVKVIAHTFESDEFSRNGMFKAGACAYLSKGDRPAKLIKAIEAAAA